VIMSNRSDALDRPLHLGCVLSCEVDAKDFLITPAVIKQGLGWPDVTASGATGSARYGALCVAAGPPTPRQSPPHR
jgi:hypothetical protein